MSTAKIQGELWGARSKDWAELLEPAWVPVFERALFHACIKPGAKLLDVGCGAGGALVIARKHGAKIAGIDASENLVAVARERLPGARIEVGEMEDLPFSNESFDIVVGINSFQFSSNLVRALCEARRVCRRGGKVFMLTWGRREDCQLMTITMPAVLALMPPPSPGSNLPDPAVGESGVKDSMRMAGLEPIESSQFSADLAFSDTSIAVRAIMSVGTVVRVSRFIGKEFVVEAINGTLRPVTRADGSVVWRNRFLWVKATKPAR